jgi:uncharacterized membrane protein
MLFLFRLLALPVTGPINGMRFVLEQIREQALAEMLSEEEIQSLLVQASIQHQAGEISDEEVEELETRLLEELRTIRRLQSADSVDAEYYEVPDPEADDTNGRS